MRPAEISAVKIEKQVTLRGIAKLTQELPEERSKAEGKREGKAQR